MFKQLVHNLAKPVEEWSRPPVKPPLMILPLGNVGAFTPGWMPSNPEHEYVSPRGQWINLKKYRDLYDLLSSGPLGEPTVVGGQFQLPDFSANMVSSDKLGIETLMRIK